MSRAYGFPAYIVGLITFFGCWAYAVVTYGWFLGIGLGWIPSIVIAVLAGALWPFLLLAIGGLLFFVFR